MGKVQIVLVTLQLASGFVSSRSYLGVCHSLFQLLQPVLRGRAGGGVVQLSLDPSQVVIQLLQIMQ